MDGFKHVGGAVKRLRQNLQLLRSQVSILRVDSLVDAGEDDGGVARELAGSKDGVPVPRPMGKSGSRRAALSRFAAALD